MIVGIDPGVTGAVACLADDGPRFMKVFDMPVFTTGKRMQINPYQLTKLCEGMCEVAKVNPILIFLEQASAMPKQGVSSTFGFGVSFGIIQGVLAGLRLPVVMVTPGSWKKRAGLIGKDKDEARTLAQRLFPEAELGHKKDIGRADALLIARFGGV